MKVYIIWDPSPGGVIQDVFLSRAEAEIALKTVPHYIYWDCFEIIEREVK